jgi:hypothetical protein
MICPHGQLEETCLECSKLANVKPPRVASKATFDEFVFSPIEGQEDVSEPIQVLDANTPSVVSALRETRLRIDDGPRITIPGNTAHLDARLGELSVPNQRTIMFEDAVDNRIREIRKHELSMHVKRV